MINRLYLLYLLFSYYVETEFSRLEGLGISAGKGLEQRVGQA